MVLASLLPLSAVGWAVALWAVVTDEHPAGNPAFAFGLAIGVCALLLWAVLYRRRDEARRHRDDERLYALGWRDRDQAMRQDGHAPNDSHA